MFFASKRFALGSALVAAAAVLLSGCNGSGSSIIGGIGNNNGYYRFINGSPDAGNVDIAIDGQQQNFATGGVAYGGVTSYRGFSAGSHTVTFYQAGNDTSTGQLYSQSISINGGTNVTVVLTGEKAPKSAGNTLGVSYFNEQPYQTPGGGFAVNFHDAAPYASGTTGLNQAVQFGYTFNGTNNNVGSPGNVGAMTNPQGLPSSIGGSANISFFANYGATSVTTNVQTINPTCTTGFPCTTGNLSLYLVDGPGAVAGGTGATAQFVGVFDNNGLITSGAIKK